MSHLKFRERRIEGLFTNFQFIDSRASRALATPGDHLQNIVRIAGENGFHATIRQIANKAPEVRESARGLSRGCTETDALDSSRNPNPALDRFARRLQICLTSRIPCVLQRSSTNFLWSTRWPLYLTFKTLYWPLEEMSKSSKTKSLRANAWLI